jgi:hypothetical protein
MLDVAAAMFARVSTRQRVSAQTLFLLRPSDSALERHESAQRMKNKADTAVLFTDGIVSLAPDREDPSARWPDDASSSCHCRSGRRIGKHRNLKVLFAVAYVTVQKCVDQKSYWWVIFAKR